MEIQFHPPLIRWHGAGDAKSEVAPTAVPESSVSVSFPVRDAETATIRSTVARLPCRFALSFDDEQALLKHEVAFSVTTNGRDVAVHKVTLADCLPLLEDSHIEWRSQLSSAVQTTEIHVTVPISTSRRPREPIANVLAYRDRALWVARKLALHKSAVTIGLMPPLLGCLVGVVVTSPLWVPLTLLVAVIGFPVWIVVAVCGSLLLAISAISSVVTVKALQSRRLKRAVRELAQSPSGQFVLFANSGNPRAPTRAQVVDQTMKFVNDDPSRKLLVSVVVDFIGNATFVVPVLGELVDLFWAPVSAAIVSAMYSESTPSVKYIAFLEEILPFTDAIPTATLAWLKENFHKEDVKKMLGKLMPAKQK